MALIRHPGALEEDCRLADIVIAPFTIGKKCRAARVIVDRRMLKAEGGRRARALCRRALDPRRVGRRRAWAQAVVPDRTIVTSAPPSTSGQAFAREDERDDDQAEKRFNGNPEE